MSWVEKRVKISIAITIFIALMIFFVSSMSFSIQASSNEMSIKSILYHISVFFFFAIFFMLSVKNKFLPVAIISSLLYAVLDEIHQFFVPGRYFAVSDILWNSLGISYAFMIYLIITKQFKNNKRLFF